MLGLSGKYAEATMRGIHNSSYGVRERESGVKVFESSKSNFDSQFNSFNARKQLENGKGSLKDLTEPVALTPPLDCRLPGNFMD
jgi:hypothetical protein